MGDRAWLLRGLPAEPFRYVQCLFQVTGVLEVAPSYETLAVFFDPFAAPDLRAVLEELNAADLEDFSSKLHMVPVCYELGEDLEAVASTLGLSKEDVIGAHCGCEYQCWALGFQPGFPYLGWLPKRLQGVPRLPQPRLRVPAGSVAVADRQTGIYPEETPGGWSILGRTPVVIVDVEADFFPIAAGDRVRFEQIGLSEFDTLAGTRLR